MFQLNFFFLLNIIRVLVVKLRQSHTSDVEQVRKAVRAAVVLLPLLGITNLLNISEAPLDRSPFEFAVWSYVTHFLTSFQGFFIATIYCFLNGEVSTHSCLPSKHVSFIWLCLGACGNNEVDKRLHVTERTSRLGSTPAISLFWKLCNQCWDGAASSTSKWKQREQVKFVFLCSKAL